MSKFKKGDNVRYIGKNSTWFEREIRKGDDDGIVLGDGYDADSVLV